MPIDPSTCWHPAAMVVLFVERRGLQWTAPISVDTTNIIRPKTNQRLFAELRVFVEISISWIWFEYLSLKEGRLNFLRAVLISLTRLNWFLFSLLLVGFICAVGARARLLLVQRGHHKIIWPGKRYPFSFHLFRGFMKDRHLVGIGWRGVELLLWKCLCCFNLTCKFIQAQGHIYYLKKSRRRSQESSRRYMWVWVTCNAVLFAWFGFTHFWDLNRSVCLHLYNAVMF